MDKKEKWLERFEDLEPEEQLEVADFIKEELGYNVLLIEEDGDDFEYDILYSEKVADFFEKYIDCLNKKKEAEETLKIIGRFDNLKNANKKKVINELSKIITKYSYVEELEKKKKICSKEGHDFGKWETRKWTKSEYIMDAHREYDVEHYEWVRSCKRCGYVETVEKEPQELITAREEAHKKRRIKELKQELKELESK